jgi:cyclophilin family peptidyl-prolyl cis-trans isomerase
MNILKNALLFTVISGSLFSENTSLLMNTNMGALQIVLFDDLTPGTVANFLNYAEDGRYNDAFFHRYVPGFVLQGGGFVTGSYSSVLTDPAIVNEPGLSNLRGTLAMAKTSDPDSATSQFFINLDDNLFLDDPSNSGGFTVFGEVLPFSMEGLVAQFESEAVPFSLGSGPFGEVPLIPNTDTLDPYYLGEDDGGQGYGFLVIESIEILTSQTESTVTHMPEPSTYFLLGSTLAFVGFQRSKQRKFHSATTTD